MTVHAIKIEAAVTSKASGVFMIRHKPSLKCYVGSAVNITARWVQLRVLLNKGKHPAKLLQSLWKQCGEHEFELKVLEICQEWTKDIQLAKEAKWLQEVAPELNDQPQTGVKPSNATKEGMAIALAIHRQKGIRSEFVAITGNLSTAVILEQIVYWHTPDKAGRTKLRVKYEGDLWLAKPREEMMQESGVTLKQYRLGIATLREMGIIAYRIGGFAGKPTPFIQLDIPVLSELVRSRNPNIVLPEWPKPLGPFGSNVCALSAQTNTVILTLNLTELKALASPKPTTEDSTKLTSEGSDVTQKFNIIKTKKVPTTAADIVAKGLKPKAADLNDIRANNMALIWKQTVPEFNPSVTFVPDFLFKQKGQLVQLVKRWGENRAGEVLYFLLSNWVKFGKFAAAQTGTKSFPEAPNLDYLLKYASEALNLYLQKAESKDSELAGATNCTAPKLGVTAKTGKVVIKKIKATPTIEDQPPPLIEQPANKKEQPGTVEEIENDPFFAQYNKPWMFKK